MPVALLYNGPLRDIYALLTAKKNLVHEEFFNLSQALRETLQRNPFGNGELGADGMKEIGMRVKTNPFSAVSETTLVVQAVKVAGKEKITAVNAGTLFKFGQVIPNNDAVFEQVFGTDRFVDVAESAPADVEANVDAALIPLVPPSAGVPAASAGPPDDREPSATPSEISLSGMGIDGDAGDGDGDEDCDDLDADMDAQGGEQGVFSPYADDVLAQLPPHTVATDGVITFTPQVVPSTVIVFIATEFFKIHYTSLSDVAPNAYEQVKALGPDHRAAKAFSAPAVMSDDHVLLFQFRDHVVKFDTLTDIDIDDIGHYIWFHMQQSEPKFDTLTDIDIDDIGHHIWVHMQQSEPNSVLFIIQPSVHHVDIPIFEKVAKPLPIWECGGTAEDTAAWVKEQTERSNRCDVLVWKLQQG